MRIWERLTSPPASLHNRHDQHRAQLLTYVLLVAMVFIPLYKILRAFSGDPESTLNQLVTTGCLALVFIVYGFSRTKYYKLGIFFLVVSLSLVLIVQGAVRSIPDRDGMYTAILWLVPVMFFTGVLTPLRATVLFILTQIVLINGVLLLVPGIRMPSDRFPFDYILIFSVMIIVAGFLAERYNTQLEKQARDLAESEGRYRGLFEAGFVGIMVHENGTLVDANAGFLAALGYTLPEVLGKPIHNFFVPVSTSKDVMDTTRFEMVARREDGSNFQVEIYRKNISYRGREAQVLAFHDITEHKQAQDSRIKLLAERERSQVLRQFISDASHDLRTPLATINTSLYLLRKTTPEQPNTVRYLDAIQAQSFHLNEVLESLLLMARLDDPDNYFELILLDLNRLASNVVESAQPAALKKHHTLDFQPEADLPFICADSDEIKRAIRLLLDNALQYTPDGGTIIVRTRHLNQEALVEVQDNGPGISPDDLPHIFQRFYRGDKARGQTQNVGAGLGLPIVKKIIETHIGTVDVETQVGEGTTFRISLPTVLQ